MMIKKIYICNYIWIFIPLQPIFHLLGHVRKIDFSSVPNGVGIQAFVTKEDAKKIKKKKGV